MCIICVKKAGVQPPAKETIENMFSANPDGAGFAYAIGGAVYIRKGLMTLETFNSALNAVYRRLGDRLIDTPFLYHFRITTSGGTKPQMCHPFPMVSDTALLCKTKLKTDIAVAHNGIIDIDIEKGLSDTATYIKSELTPYRVFGSDFYRYKAVQEAIRHRIESKLAILSSDGDIVTIGSFEMDENGLLYSNDSYVSQCDRFATMDCIVRLSDRPTGLMWRLNDTANLSASGTFQLLTNNKNRTIYIDPHTYGVYSISKSATVFYGTAVDWWTDVASDATLEECTTEVII